MSRSCCHVKNSAGAQRLLSRMYSYDAPPVLVYRDLVDEAKNYLLLPQERPLMQGPRTRPRKPIRCGEVLFAGRCRAVPAVSYNCSTP